MHYRVNLRLSVSTFVMVFSYNICRLQGKTPWPPPGGGDGILLKKTKGQYISSFGNS